MTEGSLLRLAPGEHVVHFYADEPDLIALLADYLREALAAEAAAVAIASSEHLAIVRSALNAAGEDVAAVEASGMLVLRDADETLSLFEADGDIDRAQFADVIGGLLQDAGAGGRDVRVYGEMVARLWDRGAVPAAIELEDLWNELSRGLPFALLCAYPATITDDPQSATSFSAVCACHTHVLDGAPELTGEVTGRFPAAPHAARLARRMVAGSLDEWGYDKLVDDALLVVGELSANAAAHGGADFTCAVSRVDGRVRIEVGDSSALAPVMRNVDQDALSGRGLLLIAALAHSWGWVPAAPGKVVWAELRGAPAGR